MENHNVKAYRKRSTSHTQRQKRFAQSSEVAPTDLADSLIHRPSDYGSSRRLSMTAAVRKRSHLTDTTAPAFVKTARTKRISRADEIEMEEVAETIINVRRGEEKAVETGVDNLGARFGRH